MDLLSETFKNIDDKVIQRLFDNQIPESKTLDYKREIQLKSNDDKKELIADITAFANTEGGIIIFGIEEKKNDKGQNTGLPDKTYPLNIDNRDKFLQTLEDIIRTNTEPKLSSVQIKFVPYKNDQLLILGIPKFIGLPFMVTLNSTNKFYKRKNSGKYLIDVYELSEVFLKNYKMKERAEQFRLSRLKSVRNLEFLPNLAINGSFFLHIIPLSYLDENQIDLSNHQRTEYLTSNFSPIDSGSYSHRLNLDGFLTFATNYDKMTSSYAQLFRNGTMEFYTSQLHRVSNQEKNILKVNGYYLEEACVSKIKLSFTLFDSLGVEPPYLIFISVFEMKGSVIEGPNIMWERYGDRSEVLLPSLVLDSRSDDVERKMKDLFDIFWQSANYPKSPYYNEQGDRIRPR